MLGYSDRIAHALTYLAKHYHPRAPASGGLPFLAQPYSVALILARHDADETTIVASLLHHLVEVAMPSERATTPAALVDRFGPVATGVAIDAALPLVTADGVTIPWRQRRRDLLAHLALAEPRALDVRCAVELHACGSAVSLVRRLGPEYLELHGRGAGHEAIDWYDDLCLAFSRREDWPSLSLRHELTQLTRELRQLTR